MLVFYSTGNTKDIASLDFFTIPNFHYTFARYYNSLPESKFNGVPSCCVNQDRLSNSVGALHDMRAWPDAWIEVDAFAKVFYSVMLTDLGQQNTTTNLLADPVALTLFSNNITTMKERSVETSYLKAGPARQPYQQNNSSDLSIKPSVFFIEYLCQVPTLKSAGSLILAVLVADLVFLNAAWVLLNWFAVARLDNWAAHQCEGCAENVLKLVDIEAGVQMQTKGYEPVGRRDDA